MGARIWGRMAESGDLADGSKLMYQPFKPHRDMILRGLRHWMIFYNNPTIQNIKCALYASDNSSGVHLPSTKIEESSKVWLKSEIISLDNGFFEIYYDFDNVPLQENTTYHFVFYADTYSFSESSHVAYRVAFPDPVYSQGLTVAANKVSTFPLALYVIGADL